MGLDFASPVVFAEKLQTGAQAGREGREFGAARRFGMEPDSGHSLEHKAVGQIAATAA